MIAHKIYIIGGKNMKKEFSLLDIFLMGILSAILRGIIIIPLRESDNFTEFMQSSVGNIISYIVLFSIIAVIYYLIKKFRRSK